MEINEKNKVLYEEAFIGSGDHFDIGVRNWKPDIDEHIEELCKDFILVKKNENNGKEITTIHGSITNAGGEFGYDVAAFRFDDSHSYTILLPHDENTKHGDKVKLVILKEK